MVEYTLELRIPNLDCSCRCQLNLNIEEENHPTQKFTQAVCHDIRNQLKNQGSCKINQAKLNQIIKTWIENISEGYRITTITMDLPALSLEDLDNINDSGNQELPELIEPNVSEIEPSYGMLPPLNFS